MEVDGTVRVSRKIFKDVENLQRYNCVRCNFLLQDPVQLGCGHRVCRRCADKLISNATTGTSPQCPDCGEEISEEDGVRVSTN